MINKKRFFRSQSSKIITLVIIFSFLFSSLIFSQSQNLPVRTNTNQENMVSFSRDTKFQDALKILNQYALKDEGKAITDPTGQSGAIGVEISNTHWKDALKKILLQRGLNWQENPNYYEITGAEAQKEKLKQKAEFTDTTREVRIKALFFQADRSKMNKTGVNWKILQESPGLALKQLNLGITVSQGQAQVSEGLQSGQGGGGGQQAAPIGSAIHNTIEENGDISIGTVLNIFEDNNLGKILSKPTIKVADGQEGQINIGQRFYISQRDFAGNTVQKQVRAGTQLNVTPNIIKDSSGTFIHLGLTAEKSSAQLGRARPVINEQMVETDVLLVDGERTVLGGLFTQEKQSIRSGIPVLKDLPWWVLGIRYLAGNNQVQVSRRDLLIFIKVELVPTIKERLAMKKKEMQNIESEYEDRRDSFKKNYESFENVGSTKRSNSMKHRRLEVNTSSSTTQESQTDTEESLETSQSSEVNNTQNSQSQTTTENAQYTIQIMETDNYEEALIESSRLTQKGVETFIQRANSNGEQVYRIRSGKFSTRDAAESKMEKLKSKVSQEKVGAISIGEL